MPGKRYIISLTPEERQALEQLTTTGEAPVYKVKHARILLKADTNQADGGWTDKAISDALDISRSTIGRVRHQFVEQGMDAAVGRKTATRYKDRLLDGEQEARLIALAHSEVPKGHAKWSLRLLANRMMELKYVETISYETVRQALKRTGLSLD